MTPAHDAVVRERLAKLWQPEETKVRFSDFWMAPERRRKLQIDLYTEKLRDYPAAVTLAVLDGLAPSKVLPCWFDLKCLLEERPQ